MIAFRVSWRRNSPGKPKEGEDDAWSLEEATDIAVVRLRFGGIPGAASIHTYEGKYVRRVFRDLDGRIGYQDMKDGKPVVT